jgi:cytochrome c oxidase subunit 1
MHMLGLGGMPRRVYTYLPEMHWGGLNLLESGGAMLMALSIVIFLWNVSRSRRNGEVAGPNPWRAGTLEWSTASPPPIYNFLDPPTVGGREPLWEDPPDQPVVTGLRDDMREVLLTQPLDADPQHRTEFPHPTIWPFLAAIATTALFIGSIFWAWSVIWGAIPVAITLTGWFWPKSQEAKRHREWEKWEKA